MATPLPVLPQVYYGYVWGTYLARKTGNTFCFKDASPGPVDEPTDALNADSIATALAHRWADTIGPNYPNAVTGWNSRVYALGHPSLPASERTWAGAGAGGDLVAPVVATAVIKHVVYRRGRGSQSHTSISPLTTESITADGEFLTAGARLALDNEFNNFIGNVQANYTADTGRLLDYVQLSRKGAGATYLIQSSSCELTLGTERSRTLRP